MIRPGLAVLLALAAPIGWATPRGFRFEPDAQVELRNLWMLSRDAGAERVACLAGTMDDDSVRVKRVGPLEAWADSMATSARESLEQCRPPEWLGTVHTHIAHRGGQPYSRFSGPTGA